MQMHMTNISDVRLENWNILWLHRSVNLSEDHQFIYLKWLNFKINLLKWTIFINSLICCLSNAQMQVLLRMWIHLCKESACFYWTPFSSWKRQLNLMVILARGKMRGLPDWEWSEWQSLSETPVSGFCCLCRISSVQETSHKHGRSKVLLVCDKWAFNVCWLRGQRYSTC